MCYDTVIVCNLNKYHWIETKHFACFFHYYYFFIQNPLLTLYTERQHMWLVKCLLVLLGAKDMMNKNLCFNFNEFTINWCRQWNKSNGQCKDREKNQGHIIALGQLEVSMYPGPARGLGGIGKC